jgi:putative DNA methylase
MRLGCEVTAIDINPVAWFILKCALEYPQRLAGKTLPLPRFTLESKEFTAAYRKGDGGKKKRGQHDKHQGTLTDIAEETSTDADLSWHVRTWGQWVLGRARKDLERFYPTVDGKPTVAYLWARTVTCKNCRATIPLVKTLWLCKKDKKRFRLRLKPREDKSGVDFEVVAEQLKGGNAAHRRAHDQEVGRGTMSHSGA